MITNAEYNYPLGIPRGYFNGKAVPSFLDYLRDYHVYFMRYIYYMCIMNAEGNYPYELVPTQNCISSNLADFRCNTQ